MVCLQRLAEEKSSMGSAELAAAVLAALQLCSEVVLQRSSRAMLREAVQLLQALPQVLEVTGDTLEASALTALAHLQPLAVLGAPYVLPRRTAAEVSGCAEVSSSVSWSETEPQSAAERKGKGRGEGKDAVTALQTLQAQCRSLSLRNFAQLFKLWPKAFFGRWPLVLDFQSGEVCRPGSGIQRPMLLSICDRDPVVRVRQQALSALVALLQAPQLKAWPVPLETSQKAQSSTSLTGQLAMTIRQSHALVMELMDGDELNQLNALRACADLVASTPYSKLQSGLITSLLDKLLAFAYQSELKLEASPPVLALVLALSSLLKREDCAAEITKALFRTRRPSGPSAVAACAGEASADWLFQQMLRLMTETPEMKPQTPTGARRTDGRKDRGKRPETPEEPLMIQEFALLTGRLALFVPAALPESTLTLLEQLVLSFVSQQSSMLRLRAFRLLNDLPLSEAWQFSPSFLEQLFQISQRPEPIASVRQSLLSALPGLVRCSARSELTEEHPLRQVLRQGLQDVNGGVRTAAAQALGAMASRFELDAVQWLIPLAADPTGDVRSASATALASFAPRLGEGPLRTEVAEVLLPLCSDASDKARASGLRAVGCLAEGFAEMPRSLAESLAKLLTAAVAQPPPKCQWNACRSAGQLAVCASHLPQVIQELMDALCELLGTENLKVRIQAVVALQQVTVVSDQKEVIKVAAEKALSRISCTPPPGLEEPKERQSYLEQLKAELLRLLESTASPNARTRADERTTDGGDEKMRGPATDGWCGEPGKVCPEPSRWAEL
ncbi:HEAT repeat-containing protein 6 [Durusdinium trenchii]|uniref:HEAT repeat-containing protein 6 n=1 Tax=Durusdinium trenchii TaxID=1381693 RepID=A0ABP0KH74_9DINO